jgi:hypothetical protein
MTTSDVVIFIVKSSLKRTRMALDQESLQILLEVSQRNSDFGSPISRKIARGRSLSCCAIAWSEFSNGPITPEQVASIFGLICSRTSHLDRHDGDLAAKLSNFGERRRDFSRFESHGLQLEPLN